MGTLWYRMIWCIISWRTHFYLCMTSYMYIIHYFNKLQNIPVMYNMILYLSVYVLSYVCVLAQGLLFYHQSGYCNSTTLPFGCCSTLYCKQQVHWVKVWDNFARICMIVFSKIVFNIILLVYYIMIWGLHLLYCIKWTVHILAMNWLILQPEAPVNRLHPFSVQNTI